MSRLNQIIIYQKNTGYSNYRIGGQKTIMITKQALTLKSYIKIRLAIIV